MDLQLLLRVKNEKILTTNKTGPNSIPGAHVLGSDSYALLSILCWLGRESLSHSGHSQFCLTFSILGRCPSEATGQITTEGHTYSRTPTMTDFFSIKLEILNWEIHCFSEKWGEHPSTEMDGRNDSRNFFIALSTISIFRRVFSWNPVPFEKHHGNETPVREEMDLGLWREHGAGEGLWHHLPREDYSLTPVLQKLEDGAGAAAQWVQCLL